MVAVLSIIHRYKAYFCQFKVPVFRLLEYTRGQTPYEAFTTKSRPFEPGGYGNVGNPRLLRISQEHY